MTLETPNGRRPMRMTLWITGALVLVIAAWAWWSAAWPWRLPPLVIVGVLAGEALARVLIRDVRKTVGKE